MALLDDHHVGDELLQLQYRGLAAHYAGRWEESSRALERAFEVAEDRYTKSVTRALLSLVTSDRMLDYDPPRPERLFLHYYGALNYLQRGEPDEAAVEARRLGYVLQGALEDEDASVPADLGGSLSVFAGAVFEAAGQGNDAAVAYRRARAFGERAGGNGPPPELPGWPDPDADADGASRGAEGRVLVVVERGFVAHKVERALTLFLTPGELRRVHRFRQSARSGTTSADTSDILDLAERVADRSLEGGSRRRTVRRSSRFQDVDPVLLRIAWPEIREPTRRASPASLRVAGVAAAGAAADGAPSPARAGLPGPASPAVPPIPGLEEAGFLTNTSAYELEELPEHLIVLGGGYIGLENAQLFYRLGAEVTIIEQMDQILPLEQSYLTEALQEYLEAEGITIATGATARSIRREEGKVFVEVENDTHTDTIEGSHIFVATGRRGNIENLGLEDLGIQTHGSGYLTVDDTLRTSHPHIFGAGDIIGEQQFVYTAAYEGQIAARNALNGAAEKRDYSAMPWVVFTDPQVAGIGMDELQVQQASIDYDTAKLTLDNVPRSIAARDTRGFIKLIRNKANDRLVGALHEVGDGAGAPPVVGAVEVVGLVDNHQLAAVAAARGPVEGGVARRPPGEPLDVVGGAPVGGVQFDGLPPHVVGQCVGGRRLADARCAVEDGRLAVVVPRLGPLPEVVPGGVVAPHLLQRARTVLLRPVHHRTQARGALSRCGGGGRPDTFSTTPPQRAARMRRLHGWSA
jgi:hypothetical protein